MPEAAKGGTFRVVGIEAEDVLDGVGIRGALEPERARLNGLLRAAAGGVEQRDAARVAAEVIAFERFGFGKMPLGAEHAGLLLDELPAPHLPPEIPRGGLREREAGGGAKIGLGAGGIVGVEGEIGKQDQRFAAVRALVPGKLQPLRLVSGILDDHGQRKGALEALDRASVGQEEELLGRSSAVAFSTNGEKLGVEVVAQRGGELGGGDRLDDAQVAAVARGGRTRAGIVGDDASRAARGAPRRAGHEGLETFMHGLRPVGDAASHHALAGVVEQADIRHGVGGDEHVEALALLLDSAADGLRGGGRESVVGVGPHDPVPGGKAPRLIARRREVIDVRPVGVRGCVEVVASDAAATCGDGEAFIRQLLADGADDDDLVGELGEVVEEAGHHWRADVAGDDAEGDFLWSHGCKRKARPG